MLQVYCPKCQDFTPLLFDEPYLWQGTEAAARNLICTRCLCVLSVLRGDGVGAHALQKIAELAYYASPNDPTPTNPTSPLTAGKRSKRVNRPLKLVP